MIDIELGGNLPHGLLQFKSFNHSIYANQSKQLVKQIQGYSSDCPISLVFRTFVEVTRPEALVTGARLVLIGISSALYWGTQCFIQAPDYDLPIS